MWYQIALKYNVAAKVMKGQISNHHKTINFKPILANKGSFSVKIAQRIQKRDNILQKLCPSYSLSFKVISRSFEGHRKSRNKKAHFTYSSSSSLL